VNNQIDHESKFNGNSRTRIRNRLDMFLLNMVESIYIFKYYLFQILMQLQYN